MRVSKPIARGDGGVVAILVAFFVVAFAVLAAFATDFGRAYVEKRQLSTAADAAALAGAMKAASSYLSAEPCLAITTGTGDADSNGVPDEQDIVAAAQSQNDQNASGSGRQVSLSCDANGRLSVKVDNSDNIATTFGRVAGVSNIPVSRSATALVGAAGIVEGLRPFAFCESDPVISTWLTASEAISNPDLRPVLTLPVAAVNGTPCGSASGNWGLVDFNGGANDTPDTLNWIQYGFPGALSVIQGSILCAGGPGFPSGGSIQTQMNTLQGKSIAVPLYDQVTNNGQTATCSGNASQSGNAGGNGNGNAGNGQNNGNGQNTAYQVTGFLGVTVCGWSSNNKHGGPWCVGAPPYGTPPATGDYIQIRFANITYSTQTLPNCSITPGSTCSNGVFATQLVK